MFNRPVSLSSPAAVAGLLALAGCVDPYTPNLPDGNANLLVVDGFINGNGRTRVKLSRSVNITTQTAPPVEKGARLFVVDDAGARYALTEIASGSYRSDSLQLSTARQYQLLITTSAGVAYASDPGPLKVAPAIDNVTFRRDGSLVRVALSTHDATQQSRFYRWKLTETWQFESAFYSNLEYDPVQKIIVARTVPIYTCWRTEQPSAIRQASTAQLSQDALTDVALATLDAHDERFKIRYSLLVSQYAQTPAEFNYYELLRKNTEAVGSVNDPLPVQLTGNVHRLDGTAEPVLGYVAAHTVQQKRIFIANQDLNLPTGWAFTSAYPGCTLRLGASGKDIPGLTPIQYFNDPANPPTNPNGIPDQCFYATNECADCRTRGTTTKPGFW